MSFNRKESDLVRAFYAADKDGDGSLDLFEYVSMFNDQVNIWKSFRQKENALKYVDVMRKKCAS
jgi:hypothetical protein